MEVILANYEHAGGVDTSPMHASMSENASINITVVAEIELINEESRIVESKKRGKN